MCFFFSSRRRHTRSYGDWSSDVCSSDLLLVKLHFILTDRLFVICYMCIINSLVEQIEHLYRCVYTVYLHLECMDFCTGCCIGLYRLLTFLSILISLWGCWHRQIYLTYGGC